MKKSILQFVFLIAVVCVGIAIFVALYHYFEAACLQKKPVEWYEHYAQFFFKHSFLLGIFSSLAGVILTFLFVKPRFEINPIIAWDNNNRLRFQITNNLWVSDLANVSIEMYYIRYVNKNMDERYAVIPIKENSVSIINACIDGETKRNYVGFTTSGFIWDKDYEMIRFRIIATHATTGVTRVIEREYTMDDVKRGVFKNGKFTSYESLYPTTCCKCWSNDIKERCHAIWTLSDNVLPVIQSSKTLPNITVDDYKRAKEEIKSFETDQTKAVMFPCVSNNKDTFKDMEDMITKLQEMNLINLNPGNREKRDRLVKSINQYLVFITQEMDADIWNYYMQDNRR